MLTVDKINEVYVRINCDLGEALELKSHMEVFANNYKFNQKYKARIWNGKISHFNSFTRELPIGLLGKFHSFCKKFNYKYKLNFDTSELYNNIGKETIRDFVDGLTNEYGISARDYQIEQIHESINRKRGIILSSVGSGKSLTIYLLIQLLLMQKEDRQILLIVPTTSLVEQMFSDFRDYGWGDLICYVTKLYSGQEPDFKKMLLISTWQSLQNKGSNFFKKYGVVIADECHQSKSYQIQQILKHCINASYRIGTTGTMNTSEADIMSITGYIGPVIHTIKSKELIDKGILSKITIVNMLLKYPKHVVDKNKGRSYPEEIRTINEFKPRNKAISYILQNVPDKQNSMVLCTEIAHLENIKEHLENTLDPKYIIVGIHGATKVNVREQIRKSLETEENMVIVATFGTMSQGVNTKRLHNIIFASSYKSKIKILQAVGRGLRTAKNKFKLILWDLVDDIRYKKRTGTIGENYTFLHWKERLKYYEEVEFKYINKNYDLY